jgi:hypothetical protein
MANELTVSMSMQFRKGTVATGMSKTGMEITVAGDQVTHNIQEIGTTQEALDMGDITAPGYAFFYNHDATNPVELRSGTGAADMIRLKPLEFCCFRLEATAPYAIATTAAVQLEYMIIEA